MNFQNPLIAAAAQPPERPLYVTILIAAVPAIATYLLSRKKNKLEEQKLQNELTKATAQTEAANEHAVSKGMAVGYYYNFIDPILEQLRVAKSLKISFETKEVEFKPENVELEIVVPYKLSDAAIKKALLEAKSETREGKLVFNGKPVDFLVKDNQRLIVRDFARPLEAVFKYLANLPDFKDKNGAPDIDSEKFQLRQKAEIKNFENIVAGYVNNRCKIEFRTR